MISPLGHRQIFQTANMEAIRQAHQVGEEIQRDIMKAKAAEDRLVEDQSNVRGIPESEQIRTQERQEGRGGKGTQKRQSADELEEDVKSESNSAGDADPLLDFFA
jgi:hypothetical protein